MSGWRLSRWCARLLFASAALAAASSAPGAARAADWEPSRPVRLVVPAEAGSGGDAMARAIQAIVALERFMPQPLEVVNRPGEGGAEGFDEAQAARGDPHVLVLGLSNLFTTPPLTGSVGWRDMVPVAMLALEPMALWVHAASPHHAAPGLVAAAMAGEIRVGGAAGAGQAGGMVVSAMGRATGAGFTFAPFRGGAEAARALAERRLDAAVGSRAEVMAEWDAGRVRPLCVFGRAAAAGAVRSGGVPDCRDGGVGVEYAAHSGILLPAAVTREQRAFYEALLRRVRETPAWRALLEAGMLEPAAAPDGASFSRWLAGEELRHEEWMYAGGVFARR